MSVGARHTWPPGQAPASQPSACYLLGREVARERFELLERTHDGFAIAEADLAQRGMGDLIGLRQAGINTEGFEDGELDLELLLFARDLLAARPELARATGPVR